MTNLGALKIRELQRWNECHIVGAWQHGAMLVGQKLLTGKPRYLDVQEVTNVPWPVVAVIHERESSQSWSASLAQGDPWDRLSIHVPRGRGPFTSWEDAAVDALKVCPPHAAAWSDWTIGGALCLLEQYNGLGYAARGIPSPYIWAATDQYIKGKYIADGHFDPNAVDHQIGCAALLMAMENLDPTVKGAFA